MQAKVRYALIFAVLSYFIGVALGSRVDSRFAVGGVILPWGAGVYALNTRERKEDSVTITVESRLMRMDQGAALAAASVSADTLATDASFDLTGTPTD
ncbi:MAG: hypothetical protein ACREQN_18185 [Candidatus Binataceae bacterium]